MARAVAIGLWLIRYIEEAPHMRASRITAEVIRCGFTESVHDIIACVRDAEGKVVLAAGDISRPAMPRSSLKPLQALAPQAAGVVDAFGLTQREAAIFCGSHHGESFHVEAVESILRKIGLDGSALQCGSHWPCEAASNELRSRGEEPRAAHNNCSGKHAGMLAYCVRMGLDTHTYLDQQHPLQRQNVKNLAEMADVPPEAIAVGIDGCAAPTFGLPIEGMALAFARLGAPDAAPEGLAGACRDIVAAMAAHPEMVAGTNGSCTRIMAATKGAVIVKSGAEAFSAMSIPGHRLGLALKVVDGGFRASVPAALACLCSLGIICRADLGELEDLFEPPIHNCRGDVVGRIAVTL
mgnify:CR=1 FL=1